MLCAISCHIVPWCIERGHKWMHGSLNIKDIICTQMSLWIVEGVKETYIQADLLYEHTTTDEMRAIWASWAYTNRVWLEDILTAAFCHFAGVFQHSYLQDMTSTTDDMATLRSAVVVQNVVVNSWQWLSHPSLGDFMFSVRFRHVCIRVCPRRRQDNGYSHQNHLSQTLDIWDKESIGLRKCTGWPFGDLDPRMWWLWHWYTKICLFAG